MFGYKVKKGHKKGQFEPARVRKLNEKHFSSGLRGHKRTYLTILKSADHALFKMVRYVLLRPLRPELDARTKTCLPAKTRFCHLDEPANSVTQQY
jgi:hypothetical protein